MDYEKYNWGEKDLEAFKKRVMRRVYLSWFMRKVLIPAFIILPVTAILLVKELSSLAVKSIIGTAIFKLTSFNFIGFFHYFIDAIRFTELDSLLIMVSSAGLALYFGRRIIRDLYIYWFKSPLGIPYTLRARR